MKLVKNVFIVALLLMSITIHSCGQNGTSKSPSDFSLAIKTHPEAPLIDVRTPEEYNEYHLPNAINIPWGNNFPSSVDQFSKTQPILIYCLSGGRSSAAAAAMKNMGFKQVSELKGGLLAWRAAGLDHQYKTTENHAIENFKKQISSAKHEMVLVDFYADWCIPCQKMKPNVQAIENELVNKLSVIRINVDQHKALCQELGITGIPVLHLYKKGTLIWQHKGYAEKDEISAAIH